MEKIIIFIATILVYIGAINWGVKGLFNNDLVKILNEYTFNNKKFIKIVYILIGLAALYLIYNKYQENKPKDTVKIFNLENKNEKPLLANYIIESLCKGGYIVYTKVNTNSFDNFLKKKNIFSMKNIKDVTLNDLYELKQILMKGGIKKVNTLQEVSNISKKNQVNNLELPKDNKNALIIFNLLEFM